MSGPDRAAAAMGQDGRAAPRPWGWWLLALLLGLGALRLALFAASGAGLQVDEAQYWSWSQALAWGYYSKPPVIAALIAASTTLFGTSVLGVKILAMALWLATAGLVYGFTRQLVQDAGADLAAPVTPADRAYSAESTDSADSADPDLPGRTAFWAALLFTTTPLAGLLGMSVTTDAPLLMAWTAAAWLLWRAQRQGRLADWLGLGAVIGLGLLSKYTLAALLPGALVLTGLAWLAGSGAATLRGSDRPVRGHLQPLPGLVLAGALALLMLLPHLAWNAGMGWPTLHHTADITTAAHRKDDSGAGASLGEFLGGQLVLIGPLLGVWLLTLGARALRRLPTSLGAPARWLEVLRSGTEGKRATDLAGALAPARRHLLWLSLPLLAAATAQALHAKAQINWSAPAVPLLCIWLALHLQIGSRAGESTGPAGEAARGGRRRLARWAIATSLVLTLFVAAAPTLARALGLPWPARLDIYVRMRGWDQAYAGLLPTLRDFRARHPGARVVAENRTVIGHGLWQWRQEAGLAWAAWHESGPPLDHFQLTLPHERLIQPGEPLLLLAEGPDLPEAMQRRLDDLTLLQRVDVETAPRRVLTLSLWSARLGGPANIPAVQPSPATPPPSAASSRP